ncbi:LacI family DNA-binding transcriptional regulator [Candidatus Aquiluna sp. UB-MaderosW2red]|uniref:LacI family DNA-binding transcriptional regulator n=1 Tax=Candidatus Aquiluna sp. UB-MaderosW2red TaxID=1855377 RepID=UPI000875CC47|nr:LacI family DNA-binding transcriptional regulator [Candidatus Aquiluna sp. UB-MaderosW2red]SCX02338.1 DNA-binding transcriptional regulator, LacI/PurR family [Candidatus Aquiluna sp. UB-MaderosW2red]
MVGIIEVAQRAGVSTATVSRALNGKAHVSARAREKVLKAAQELGYVASSSAYSLATGRSKNIGVVMPFIDRWYFSNLLENAVNALVARGYDVTLYNLSGGETHRRRIFEDLVLRKRVDGVLTVAVKLSPQELSRLSEINKPIIGIGGPIPGARSLAIDDEGAGRLATQHLISLGHTEIGMISGTPATEMDFHQPYLRKTGYHEALLDANLDFHPQWMAEADFTVPGGYHAAKQMLGDPRNAPTAIFCASDEMGFGAIQAARDLGYRVPQDISVIGMDGHPLGEFYGLSTIEQRPSAQGVKGANMIVDIIESEDPKQLLNFEQVNQWPIELLVRSSTAKRSS